MLSRGKRIITPLNEKNRRINIQLIKSFEKFLQSLSFKDIGLIVV